MAEVDPTQPTTAEIDSVYEVLQSLDPDAEGVRVEPIQMLLGWRGWRKIHRALAALEASGRVARKNDPRNARVDNFIWQEGER